MTSKYKPVPTHEELMGRTPEEYQRLRRQSKVWEPATMRVLREAGLRKGMSCLDVGCGPGEVMRLMGELVGATGHVTGLDYDDKAGRQAVEMLQATIKSRFTFIEQDIEAAEDIPGQPFDVTYARFFLLHARDPLAVLRKMYGWTKPGGCIVVQDFNAHPGDIYPKAEFLEEIEKVISRTARHGGKDLKIGHKLPAYFVEAGIGDPDGTDVAGTIGSLKEYGWLVGETYRNLLPRAIQMGLTTETESKASLEKLDQIEKSERYYSALLPSVIGVWKHKPLN
jgi:ubiquinone/menaquinone biosynthesis C-methylase UbiE